MRALNQSGNPYKQYMVSIKKSLYMHANRTFIFKAGNWKNKKFHIFRSEVIKPYINTHCLKSLAIFSFNLSF